ncbi:MAG: hypothetical protein Q7T18_03135 [Sedimentisphaerales bacterium]|nr:hypothetical protein [Sedimentisphaerales bacterium]
MKKNEGITVRKNYIAVAMADQAELARDYVEMLQANQVPARIAAKDEMVSSGHTTIVVPEEFVEQAQSLIQARNSVTDFCEYIYGEDASDTLEEMEG